jgi:AraC-like DNA-binding protein
LHDPANRGDSGQLGVARTAALGFNGRMSSLAELQALIARHAREGQPDTALPGVRATISRQPTQPVHHVTRPGFAIVAQGAKETLLGDRLFEYGEGDFIVTSVDLPICARIVRASAGRPYLACGVTLEPAAIAALLLESAGSDAPAPAPCGYGVRRAPVELVDCAVRLLRLLGQPRDAPVLRPLIEREILWRLLGGEQGGRVRQIGLADSRLAQVSHAIRHLRERYAHAVSVDELAALAAMSVSSFHRHFRAVTAMTPIQYQKQIRLQEARARLLSDAEDVAAVGFAVGYESASQFSREYSRMFGAPPGRDAARLRQVAPAERVAT